MTTPARPRCRPVPSTTITLPVAQTFPLAEIAERFVNTVRRPEAHRVSEAGQVRGKLVLLVGGCGTLRGRIDG